MKKWTLALMGVCAAALVLTACQRSDTDTSTAGTSASSAAQSGSGAVSTSDASGGGDPAANLAGGVSGTGEAAASGDTAVPASADAQTQNAGTDTSAAAQQPTAVTDTADTSVGTNDDSSVNDTYDAQNQSGEPIADNADADWAGVYAGDNGETLTITNVGSDSFYFVFAVCGIGGTANGSGSEAVYNGDDDNNIVFTYAGDIIYVSVTNNNGDDTSEAAMVGTYTYTDNDSTAVTE